MADSVTDHCRELERCNQRGGRMLSVFDLLEAQTLELDLAAHLMARISRGASFMVGAMPGGAGKTTVMCALLNLIPADARLVAATPEAIRPVRDNAPPCRRYCYVCHEIGGGLYFGYLWGRDLRRYCGLAEQGHLLATNLHADTFEQAVDQVCGDNGVPPAHFRRFRLVLFLSVEGGFWDARRRITTVHESDGTGPHRLIWEAGRATARLPHAVSPADDEYTCACKDFLRAGLEAGVRTIEQTRKRVLAFLTKHQ